MRAVVLHEYGGPSKLKYEESPDPVAGEGQVLVRVAATSVNPIDYKMRSGAAKARFPMEFPGILGRDVAGTVRAVGEGVTGFTVGERVMALASKTYAELTVVKAADLAKVPDGMEMTMAGALPLVTLTGEQLITRGTEIQAGQTVLVAGATGGVGRTAVFTAKKAGAKVIAGVRKKQVEEAGQLGAEEVLALDDKEAMEKLGFVDAVADAVGGAVAEMLMGKVKQGGVFASVLGPPGNATMHPTVRVVPVMCVPNAMVLRTLAEDVLAGRLTIPVDRVMPLEDAGEAQAAAEKGGIGKVVLVA